MESTLREVIRERLGHSRKTSQLALSQLSLQMSGCFALSKNEFPLFSILSENMERLLSDCDISKFPEIGREKAMDVLGELSNYACIFAPMAEKSEWYTRVVLLMEEIKSSYPLSASGQ